MSRMALSALIDDTLQRNGWSDRDVVREAERQGHKLNPTEISNWRHGGMKQLVARKIEALAAGLRLPPHVIALAVLQDHGITVPVDGVSAEQAVEADYTLSAKAKTFLLSIIEQDRAEV